jgi:hypothetical protein
MISRRARRGGALVSSKWLEATAVAMIRDEDDGDGDGVVWSPWTRRTRLVVSTFLTAKVWWSEHKTTSSLGVPLKQRLCVVVVVVRGGGGGGGGKSLEPN